MSIIHYLVTKDFSIEFDETNNKLFIDGKEPDKFSNETSGKQLNPDEKKEHANTLKVSFYKKKLEKQYENVIILSGSGTSVGVGKEGKVGKTMKEVWNKVAQDKEIKLEDFCKSISYEDFEKENLERLLSYAKRAEEFSDKFNDVDIKGTIKKIEELIKTDCTLLLPENSPHEILLNKLAKRKTKYPRAKIFTLNYDTLFEQAAASGKFIIIDGFSYSIPREFNGGNFKIDFVLRENSRITAEENYLPKIFHLYKIHGSVNWTKKGNVIQIEEDAKAPHMIFPNDTKYEHSYEQPFFEMMSRFQSELRKENVLLICIGFSFNDKHITTVIKEAVIQNPSFELMVIDKELKQNDGMKWLQEKAMLDSRLCLIKETFEEFSKNFPEINTVTKEDILQQIYQEPNE
ncbi:MAG: SIR2 family protein [Bacteroidota bacterium]